MLFLFRKLKKYTYNCFEYFLFSEKDAASYGYEFSAPKAGFQNPVGKVPRTPELR